MILTEMIGTTKVLPCIGKPNYKQMLQSTKFQGVEGTIQMKKVALAGFVTSLCLFVAAHYIELIFGGYWLLTVLSMTGAMALVFAVFLIPIGNIIVPAFLIMLAGIIGYLEFDGDWFGTIFIGIRQMRSIIVLLLIVPIVGWVLKEEPYAEELMFFSRKWLISSGRFFAGTIFLGQLITYFLLAGSVPVNYQIMNNFLKYRTGDVWETFKSRSALRGFALSTFWVLSIPSFVYAVDSVGASLSLVILQGFLFSLVGIALSVIGLRMLEQKHAVRLSDEIRYELQRIEKERTEYSKGTGIVIEFTLLFLTLLGSILMVSSLFSIDLLTAMPPVIILWTLTYFILKKRNIRSFTQESYSYITSSLRWKAPEMMIMLTAGPLIYGLNTSGLAPAFVEWAYQITSGMAWLNFLWLLPLFVLIMGFSGLGAMTAMVLIGGTLQTIHLPYPPELIVFSLTIGIVLTSIACPFAVPVILLSGQNGRRLMTNSFRENWVFAIAIYAAGQLYIQLMLIFFN